MEFLSCNVVADWPAPALDFRFWDRAIIFRQVIKHPLRPAFYASFIALHTQFDFANQFWGLKTCCKSAKWRELASICSVKCLNHKAPKPDCLNFRKIRILHAMHQSLQSKSIAISLMPSIGARDFTFPERYRIQVWAGCFSCRQKGI